MTKSDNVIELRGGLPTKDQMIKDLKPHTDLSVTALRKMPKDDIAGMLKKVSAAEKSPRTFTNKGQDCKEDGCTKPAYSRQMCKAHHGRWYRAQGDNKAKAAAASKKSRESAKTRAAGEKAVTK